MTKINQNTPVINQYHSIKNDHKDKILLFHLGDFYEMFFEDAEIVSKVLGLTLTYRKNGQEKIFMCGIPVANKDFYIKKLLKESLKIAVCEQVETPEMCKARGGNLVIREITAIYTSGTYVDETSYVNNYILILKSAFQTNSNEDLNIIYSLYYDLGTEEFFYEQIYAKDLKNLLCRIDPKEIILEEKEKLCLNDYEEFATYININLDQYYYIYHQELLQSNVNRNILYETFGPSVKIENFLNKESLEFVLTMELLFQFLKNTYNSPPKNGPIVSHKSIETFLDKYTINNLDLFNEKGSLYNLLNKNFTPMGKRLLRKMLIKPLIQKEYINKRLEVVNFFYYQILRKTQLYFKIKEFIRNIGDANKILFFFKEKILKNKNSKVTPIMINLFLNSLQNAENIIEVLKQNENLPTLLVEMIYNYKPMTAYKKLLKIFDKNEEFFKEDFLNEIYEDNNIKNILNKIKNHQEDIKKLIPNVKLNNNNIIGYFFEITNKDKNLLEETNNDFIIRQTLLNNIRFTTKILLELECNLKLVEVKRTEICQKIINEFLGNILKEEDQIKNLMEIIAYIDVFFSFGNVAIENNFFYPKILDKSIEDKCCFSYKNGRHPILCNLKNTFITNDLNMEDKYLTFITGPNMGGKSTFMRTTALIILLAQIGSYVPAENLILRPFNNLFVRIGFSDDPLEGESTFFKEMKECSDILNQCTDKFNIVFFDEICRGTSYEDGILLSKAIIQYLDKHAISGLISSHYLELGQFLQKNLSNKINILYTSYQYENNSLKFLYKIEEGIIEKSFGIEVAAMAGLPIEIIQNVNILKEQKD